MEMTLQRFGTATFASRPGAPCFLSALALVAMMILPLPVFLLDTFL